jgi:hypothetical protein
VKQHEQTHQEAKRTSFLQGGMSDGVVVADGTLWALLPDNLTVRWARCLTL